MAAPILSLGQGATVEYIRQFGVQANGSVADSTGTYVIVDNSRADYPLSLFGGVSEQLWKFDNATGAVIWTRQVYTSPNPQLCSSPFAICTRAVASSIAMDLSGIYVAVGDLADDLSSPSRQLIKLNRNGDQLWNRSLDPGDLPLSIATFNGAEYLTSHQISVPGSGEIYKFDSDGHFQWKRAPLSNYRYGRLGVDASGIFVVFVLSPQTGLLRLDLEANLVWERPILGAAQLGTPLVHPTGIYLGGKTLTSGSFALLFSRFDRDGNVTWTQSVPIADPRGNSDVDSAAADATGVLFAGASSPLPGQISFGEVDVFVRKFAFDGTVQWTTVFGTSTSEVAAGVSIVDGALMLAGTTGGVFAGNSVPATPTGFLARLELPAPPPASLMTLLNNLPAGGGRNGLLGKTNALCNELVSFEYDLRAQRGNSIPPNDADLIVAKVGEAASLLGCVQ